MLYGIGSTGSLSDLRYGKTDDGAYKQGNSLFRFWYPVISIFQVALHLRYARTTERWTLTSAHVTAIPQKCLLMWGNFVRNVCTWCYRSGSVTSWWRHQMKTFSALLALCAGNSPVTVTRSFDIFFDLRLNKRLSKQWRGWWFETPLRSLWRHCNVSVYSLWPRKKRPPFRR